MNMGLIRAAQARAASAVALSNHLLWDEAKMIMRTAVGAGDAMSLAGAVRSYRKIIADDAELNFTTYGDYIVCDGDRMKAVMAINLELPDEAFVNGGSSL